MASQTQAHTGTASGDLSVRGKTTVVGHGSNFWLFSYRDGFDLTHPPSPSSPSVYPRLVMQTTTSQITIAPVKTALVIIDMQNFFLSSAMGRTRGEGHEAEKALLKYGIPAARSSGIQVLWLNWGITAEGLEAMPPSLCRAFGFITSPDGAFEVEDDGGLHPSKPLNTGLGKLRRIERKRDGGLGEPLGDVTLDDGTVVDGGRVLVRDQWNSTLHPPLEAEYRRGLHSEIPDVYFHKERMSGFWDASSACHSFLRERGITTLLFTGVNTDQCVLSSVYDAHHQGFDTVVLMDGCGTTSPEYTKQMVEFNCRKGTGFVSTCEALAKGAEALVLG